MRKSSVRVTIDGREVTVSRARLGLFLQLERHLVDLQSALRDRDSGSIIAAIRSYLELATGEPIVMKDMPWIAFYGTFLLIRSLNSLPRDIPMLRRGGFNKRDPSPWDHDERPFVLWIHIIASAYGWSRTEIEDLWPEEAAIYVQEILTDQQLDREWEHSLSPVAHPIDKRGKDQFRPMRRPSWMASRPKKTRIPRKLLPSGTIIDLSGVAIEDLDD